jgi:dihydrofolate reductase
MRRIRYSVVMSLDGFIAGPNGEADWIVHEPAIDFSALFAQFDTLLIGRRTFEIMAKAGRPTIPGIKTVVLSRTVRQEDHPKVTVVSEDTEQYVASLRAAPGKDIWLFGGGELFRRLLAADLVDTVEVGVVPVLLGRGIPLLPTPAGQTKLCLTAHRVYPSGIVFLEYAIAR